MPMLSLQKAIEDAPNVILDLPNEIWKDVIGFEGIYQISNFYRVKSFGRYRPQKDGKQKFYKEKLLKIANKDGYGIIGLYKDDGTHSMKRVHVIMAECFIPNPNNYPLVRHLNDIRTDNRLENLAWGTYSDNAFDSISNGNSKVGENHHLSKLSSQDIIDIKKLFNEGANREELSKKFNVSKRQISAVKNGTKRKYDNI